MGTRKFSIIAITLAAALAGCGPDQFDLLGGESNQQPQMQFKSPGPSTGTIDTSTLVRLKTYNVDANAEVSVFYYTENNSDTAAILTGKSPSNGGEVAFNWDTSSLSSGDYLLYANLDFDGQTITAYPETILKISHNAAGADPEVTLVSPNGGSTYYIGEAITVSWAGTDADGDSLAYTLAYSTDSGASWVKVASAISDTTYSWATDGLTASNQYLLSVTAQDGNGGEGSDLSDSVFTIKNTVTWETDIEPMMLASCGGSSCHSTGGDWDDNFDSDVYSNGTSTGVSQKASRVYARSIFTDEMPPAASGYPSLTEQQKSDFLEWMNTGFTE